MIKMSWTRLIIINIIILLLFQFLLVNGQIEFTVAPASLTVTEDERSFIVRLSSDDLMMSNDDIITINIITSDAGALNGTDYLVPSNLIVNTTDPSMTTINVTVSIVDDNITEYDESAVIMFESSNVTFTPSNVSFTISDNDAITVSINNTDVRLSEGEVIVLCASTNGPHSTAFNVTATTSSSDDINPSTDVLLFGPGDMMKCSSFMIVDTDSPEGEESLTIGWSLSSTTPTVTLTGPNTTTITIPSQLVVSVLNGSMISVIEGAIVKICLMLNGMDRVTGVNVSYTITGDTNVLDYSGLSSPGTISFMTDVQCITLNITSDRVVENNESISVQFGSVIGADPPSTDTIEINIVDDTAVSVVINSSVTVYDSSLSVQLCSSLSNDQVTFHGVTLTLTATATGGNATSGVDYSNFSMNVIPMVPGCGSVLIMNNGVRGNRLLTINWMLMTSPQISDNRISLDTALTNINIIDTDYATIGFANRSIIVSESVGSVRVFLSNISGMISVPFNVAITADRPDRTSGNLFSLSTSYDDFSWSLSRQPIVVNINDNDVINQGNRTLTLSLSILDSNNLNISIENGRAAITVTEDDFPSPSPTTTPSPTETPSPSETPTESSAPAGFFNTITIVGIIVGVVILGLLLLLLLVCVIACIKVRSNRQGFYATQEDKEEAPQMLRYSASLRSLQSQTVMPVDSRDKENEYLV